MAWADCRFRPGCTSNDTVISSSTSETTCAAPTRVPIDATSNTVDHFVPGLGVESTTSGGTARIGLTYYFYPAANCTATTCQLSVGYVSSTSGDTTWSAATQIAGPMSLSWIPNTSGHMFGDYISTSVRHGANAYPAIPIATPGQPSTWACSSPPAACPLSAAHPRPARRPRTQ